MSKRNHSYRKVKALFENYYRYIFQGPRRCGKTTKIVEEAIKNLLAGYDVDVYAAQNSGCDVLRREIYRDLGAANLANLTHKVRVRRANQLTANLYRGRTNIRVLIDELPQVYSYADMNDASWYTLLCSNIFAAASYTPDSYAHNVERLLERVERDHPFMRITKLQSREERRYGSAHSSIRGFDASHVIVDEVAHMPAWATATSSHLTIDAESMARWTTTATAPTDGALTTQMLTDAFEHARSGFARTEPQSLFIDPATYRHLTSVAIN